MEIREAVQRLFRVRGLVILALFVTGLAAGYVVHKAFESTTYTASARLVMGGSVPQDADWAAALAGTVQGIVTSPDRISAALADAGVTRDIVKFTKEIDTESLSDSSVLELSVTDTSARVATTVANTLANGAVATLNAQQQQPSELLLAQLQAQIDPLASEIDSIDRQVAAAASNPSLLSALAAQRSDVSTQMTALITKRADIEQQMVESVGASVIAPAVKPALPDPSRLPLDLILGSLAGLIIGVGLAALLETLRPTLVGREAIERALGAPVLGVMPDGASTVGEVLALSTRLRRAAEGAKATTAVLWSGGEDLRDVARRLQTAKPVVVQTAGRPSFKVRSVVTGEAVTPRCGLVVVVPPVVALHTIERAAEFSSTDGLSILGAIIRPQPRRPGWTRRPGAATKPTSAVRPDVEDAGEQASAVLVS